MNIRIVEELYKLNITNTTDRIILRGIILFALEHCFDFGRICSELTIADSQSSYIAALDIIYRDAVHQLDRSETQSSGLE